MKNIKKGNETQFLIDLENAFKLRKEILKSLGINGNYEGIGHCVLGYIDGNYPNTLARKENRVYYID